MTQVNSRLGRDAILLEPVKLNTAIHFCKRLLCKVDFSAIFQGYNNYSDTALPSFHLVSFLFLLWSGLPMRHHCHLTTSCRRKSVSSALSPPPPPECRSRSFLSILSSWPSSLSLPFTFPRPCVCPCSIALAIRHIRRILICILRPYVNMKRRTP